MIAGSSFLGILVAGAAALAESLSPSELVLQAERERVELITRISPSVVCIYDSAKRGGGSGVLIDAEGYGLTNFHVVAGMLNTRKGWGGLNDGRLYELEVLGIDPTGDVAMFRLIGRERFPFVSIGDSSQVHVGDDVLALGNPFVLSEDYSPSVTLGIVSGVNRYQWGVRNNLIYSDCIQVDAPINPGNSGGPLFNMSGEVIGINGRISVNTRGRFNVGFAYAISSNQIKRFLPSLRAGLLARHGTLQATVEQDSSGSVVVRNVAPSGAAAKAGIESGDRLSSLDGERIGSPNRFASLVGTYPADWPVKLRLERAQQSVEIAVRLDPIEPQLPQPFTVDRAINEREARRVLERFQRSVFGGRTPAPLQETKWNVRRAYQPSTDGSLRPPENFEASVTAGEPIRWRRLRDDGTADALIEFDEKRAVQVRILETGFTDGSQLFDLAPDDAVVFQSLYRLQNSWLTPSQDMDISEISHAGGDGFYWESDGVVRTLELLTGPVADNATGVFAFEPASGRISTVQIKDNTSGRMVTMSLSDHRDVGGMVWPTSIEVQGEGFAYRDTLSFHSEARP